MHRDTMEEWDLAANEDGIVVDGYGNEFRDEDGMHYVEDQCQWCKKWFYWNESSHDDFCSDYCKLEEYNNS
jgi:hypothetical protein